MMNDVANYAERSLAPGEMVSGVQVITNSPEAIRRILRVLNLRDLLNCKRVCKNWRFYADKILNERQRVRTLLARKTSKSTWVAMADVAEVEEFFKDLDISVAFVLLFGKLPLSRPCVGGHDFFSLQPLLPADCKIIGGLSSAGIIGTDTKSGKCDALQKPRTDCLSCMVFPKIDGLTIRTFHLSMERYQRESFNPTTSDLDTFFGIPNDERVKCVLLICPSYMPFDVVRDVYAAFWFREQGRVALCGGSVEDVIELEPGDREIREHGLIGIAFCGDDRVSAGSIVIPHHAKTKPKVQSVLRQFPPLATPSGRKGIRFGFAFTCCARSLKSSDETELIQAQFPDTPIIGVFSMGECGITCWSSPSTTANKRESTVGESDHRLTIDQLPDVILSYTTVVATVVVDH